MNIKNLDFYNFNCIKCGTEGIKEFFDFYELKTYVKKRSTYQTMQNTLQMIKIPVCRDCRIEFNKWNDKYGGSRSSVRDSLWGLCCAIIAIIFFFGNAFIGIMSPFGIPLVAFIFLGVGFLAILALVRCVYNTYRNIKSMQEIECPHRYVKFDGGTTYVKPRGIGNWIKYDIWLKNTTKIDENKIFETQLNLQRNLEMKQSINVIYCPECGERYNKGKDFCINCGKDLRTI